MSRMITGSLLALTLCMPGSCWPQKRLTSNTANLTTLKFSVEEAKDWSNLFLRKSGWIGGDGIFAIPLNGVDTTGATTEVQ